MLLGCVVSHDIRPVRIPPRVLTSVMKTLLSRFLSLKHTLPSLHSLFLACQLDQCRVPYIINYKRLHPLFPTRRSVAQWGDLRFTGFHLGSVPAFLQNTTNSRVNRMLY